MGATKVTALKYTNVNLGDYVFLQDGTCYPDKPWGFTFPTPDGISFKTNKSYKVVDLRSDKTWVYIESGDLVIKIMNSDISSIDKKRKHKRS